MARAERDTADREEALEALARLDEFADGQFATWPADRVIATHVPNRS